MIIPEAEIERIRAYIRDNKRTVVAERAGLARDTLRNFERPDWEPKRRTILALLELINADCNKAA